MDKSEKLGKNDNVWSEKLTGWMTPKAVAIVLTICYILSLIPMLWIARYNYPSADDYSNGSRCHHVWEASHSFIRVVGEAISRMVDEWFEWRGCFTSSFLSALTPNVFGEEWYSLTTWLVLGILSISLIYLFHVVFCGIFGADQYRAHSIAILTLFVTIQCMGEQERVEAFFWYSGAINYVFIHGMSLLFLGLLLSLIVNQKKKKIGTLITASVLGFLVGGGNQVTMLNIAIVLFIVAALITLQKKWNKYKMIGFPIGMFYLGCILSIVAPGNFVRASSATGMNPIKAIMVSFYYGFDLALSEWTAWPLLIVILIMVPMFWHMAGKTEFHFPYPMAVSIFGYCLVSAMFTPPLYVMGNVEAGRLKALPYIMYVMVLVLSVGYVVGWARKKYDRYVAVPNEDIVQENLNRDAIYLLGCIAFFAFGSALTMIPEPHYYAASSAMIDLMNGNAKAYGTAHEERKSVYLSRPEGRVEVEALESQPSLLFFSDITEDEQDWTNQGVARFYDLDGVVLKRIGSD